VLGLPSLASAQTTYRVGPGEARRELAELPALGPGDVVEVLGGATYAGGMIFDFDWDGTAAMPITIRGVPDSTGARPVIAGATNTLEFQGDHYVVENLEVTGGSFRCIYHHAHDITIRDTLVHDCPAHGILGADSDSGSLTLERVEVHSCGMGDRQHQIYMATDEVAHPGAVFRMRFCWIHDATGGNNVKSRAERNEIHYNWIEGAFYHELELIGPDGMAEDLAREDSDVVGNVFVKSGANERFAVVRFGGDGTGQTHGRYRFVANTVVVAPGSTSAVFRLFDGLESIEMHDNVFVMRGGGGVNLLREVEAVWASGARVVGGSHNWVSTGSTNVPPEWTATITGDDPGLVDVAGLDLRPTMTAPVVDQGLASPPTIAAFPFPGGLAVPLFSPVHGVGGIERPDVPPLDIGAYEFGSAPPRVDAGPPMPSEDAGTTPGVDSGGTGVDASTGPGADAGPTMAPGGCGCRAAGHDGPLPPAAGLLAVAIALLARRRA
jgi:MYXO-CTERM domain-containing protein